MNAEASHLNQEAGETEQPIEPRVSVVIPFAGHSESLQQCLQALGAGPECPLEIIVVDNGSYEDLSWLEDESRFGRINLLKLPRDFGLTKALNVGLKSVNPETNFVLALSPFVVLSQDAPQQLASLLVEREDATAAAPLLVDEQGRPIQQVAELLSAAEFASFWHPERFWKPLEHARGEIVEVQAARWDALMIRYGFLRAARFLDESFGQFWADVDLAYQIFRAGKKLLVLTTATGVHRLPGFEQPYPESFRPLLLADAAGGAARLVAKHFGTLPGIKLRLQLFLQVLARCFSSIFRGRGIGENLAFAGYFLTGQKIDGYHPYPG